MLFFKKKEEVARIYHGLSSSEMKHLDKVGIQEWFAKGSPVFRKGQSGDEMLIIMDGAIRIVDDTVTPPKSIALLRQGELFGELSVTAPATKRGKQESLRRSATALAAADTVLFVIREEAFRNLLEREPDLASKLLMNLFYITGERLRDSIQGKLLDETVMAPKLLRGLKDAEKKKLLKYSNVIHAVQGQPVFLEGQVGTELYCVLTGTIAITKKEGGQSKRLAVMGEGDVFGELGLATRKARMASAVALTDSDLLVMSEDDLNKLRKKNPEIGTKLFFNLFRIVTTRMRSLIVPMVV
jgi:CRP-like cAMP-binding protein